nr:fructosamine kinase family protein [Motiliproteus sp. SC1-56]
MVQDEAGNEYVLKQGAVAEDVFPAEAAGLRALAETGTVSAAHVLWASSDTLVQPYYPTQAPTPAYWARFGRQLAALHLRPAPGFGFEQDTYCGASPQPNPRYRDGHRFFAEQRLLFQGRRAHDRGLLNSREMSSLEKLAADLENRIPTQPPSLIHGDLWAGNHLCYRDRPVLIDPAAHWGWAEVELAMTRLFGGFPQRFYDAYIELNPLQPAWQERLALYNLYHLLNHLNLFGGSYHAQVTAVLQHYC